MKCRPECPVCILSVRAREILSSDLSDEEKFHVLKLVANKIFELASPNTLTVVVASEAYRIVREYIGYDPYREYKRRCNEVAEDVLRRVRDLLYRGDEYEIFRKLVIASVNANAIDPGVATYSFSIERLSEVLLEEPKVSEIDKLYRYIKRAKSIVFIPDNCGEVIFDRELLRYVKRCVNPSCEIYVIGKSEPFQNDVTYGELLELGFDEFANVVDGETEYFSSLVEGHYSKVVDRLVSESDIVVCKGMANFEAVDELHWTTPIAYLLKAKCKPIADAFNTSVNATVVTIKVER